MRNNYSPLTENAALFFLRKLGSLMSAFTIAALIAGLSGCGRGGDVPQLPANALLRFVNAAPDLGNVEFTIGTTKMTLAPRAVGAAIAVDSGMATITARETAEGELLQYSANLLTGEELVVGVAINASAKAELVKVASVPLAGSGAGIVYANLTSFHPSIDVYVLTTGATLSTSSPSMTGVPFKFFVLSAVTPGTYEIVVTPAGKQTELFRSLPITVASGATTILIGMQNSVQVLTPLPVLVAGSQVTPLVDSRPSVQILRPLASNYLVFERFTIASIETKLTVDDDVVAIPRFTSAQGAIYHVSPGARSFGPGSYFGRFPLTIAAELSYVQRYGINGYSVVHETPSTGYLAPEVTGDYPVPAGKARIRMHVDNCCRNTDVRVGGVLLQANVRQGEWLFDLEPGSFLVQISMPGTMQGEGSAQFTTSVGQYYQVHIFDIGQISAQFHYLGGGPVLRSIFVDSDD
jgi:hypothetical protein